MLLTYVLQDNSKWAVRWAARLRAPLASFLLLFFFSQATLSLLRTPIFFFAPAPLGSLFAGYQNHCQQFYVLQGDGYV